MVSFSDISEEIPNEDKPPLFQEEIPDFFYAENGGLLSKTNQLFWRENGYVILRNAIPYEVIDRYCEQFITERDSKPSPRINKKWRDNVPYMNVPVIRDLCCNEVIDEILHSLIGYKCGLHLNLIEWVSTERAWHQDDYLNPEYINNHYAAVWIALDDIHPDSGPFEFIPGSHKWPLLRRGKVWDAAPNEMKALPNWHTDWPSLTQEFVSEAIEEEISRRGATVETFIPANKGDILVWSGGLVHRGSVPKVRGSERRAMIAHYSSIQHRRDMPIIAYHNNEGAYFVL